MSPAKHKLTLSGAAHEDLHIIAEYGLREWGEARAKTYQAKLWGHVRHLQAYPLAGTVAMETAAGLLRQWPAERHVILYRTGTKQVHIIRILHSSMDIVKHLSH